MRSAYMVHVHDSQWRPTKAIKRTSTVSSGGCAIPLADPHSLSAQWQWHSSRIRPWRELTALGRSVDFAADDGAARRAPARSADPYEGIARKRRIEPSQACGHSLGVLLSSRCREVGCRGSLRHLSRLAIVTHCREQTEEARGAIVGGGIQRRRRRPRTMELLGDSDSPALSPQQPVAPRCVASGPCRNVLRHARRGGERECRQPLARRAAPDEVIARVQRMASIGGRRRSRQRGPIGGARSVAARGQVGWERIRARPQRARASAGGHAPRKARRGVPNERSNSWIRRQTITKTPLFSPKKGDAW